MKKKFKEETRERTNVPSFHLLCTSQHNDINRLLQFIYVGICSKFIINKDFFFKKKILCRIFPKLIHSYNIGFPYRIRKVIKNISINILGHDGKNS